MELYLIRHGQSTNNALMEDQTERNYDPELTETGRAQAKHLADYLANGNNRDRLIRYRINESERGQRHGFGTTHLYCSAMHRALQTAQPVGQALGLQPQVWLEIHEHGGVYLNIDGVITGYGGRTRSEIMHEFSGYGLPETLTEAGWWHPEDGEESLAKCQGRAIQVATILRQRAVEDATKNDVVALITHGMFMDALLKAFFNQLPGRGYFHSHYNTAITRLDLSSSGETRLRYSNRFDHLPDSLVTA